jgi:hypothetical protein
MPVQNAPSEECTGAVRGDQQICAQQILVQFEGPLQICRAGFLLAFKNYLEVHINLDALRAQGVECRQQRNDDLSSEEDGLQGLRQRRPVQCNAGQSGATRANRATEVPDCTRLRMHPLKSIVPREPLTASWQARAAFLAMGDYLHRLSY